MHDRLMTERLDVFEKRLNDYWHGLRLISLNLPPYRELLNVVREVLDEASANTIQHVTMERLRTAFNRVPPQERGDLA